MALTSPVNQTFWTDVAIGALSSDQLNPLLLSPGGALTFSLVQDFSNSTGLGKTSDVELSAAFDPLEASDFLNFGSTSYALPGTPPGNTS